MIPVSFFSSYSKTIGGYSSILIKGYYYVSLVGVVGGVWEQRSTNFIIANVSDQQPTSSLLQEKASELQRREQMGVKLQE